MITRVFRGLIPLSGFTERLLPNNARDTKNHDCHTYLRHRELGRGGIGAVVFLRCLLL